MSYSVFTMNDDVGISETTVESLLKSNSSSVRFFLDWHLACAGCGFARFCTLKSVCKTYGLDETAFLADAQKLIVQNIQIRSIE